MQAYRPRSLGFHLSPELRLEQLMGQVVDEEYETVEMTWDSLLGPGGQWARGVTHEMIVDAARLLIRRERHLRRRRNEQLRGGRQSQWSPHPWQWQLRGPSRGNLMYGLTYASENGPPPMPPSLPSPVGSQEGEVREPSLDPDEPLPSVEIDAGNDSPVPDGDSDAGNLETQPRSAGPSLEAIPQQGPSSPDESPVPDADSGAGDSGAEDSEDGPDEPLPPVEINALDVPPVADVHSGAGDSEDNLDEPLPSAEIDADTLGSEPPVADGEPGSGDSEDDPDEPLPPVGIDADNDSPVANGKSPLVDGESPLADGEPPLADGESPVADGEAPVADGDDSGPGASQKDDPDPGDSERDDPGAGDSEKVDRPAGPFLEATPEQGPSPPDEEGVGG